jgi:protein-L-isoaspartate(D-aspartate) O-methyltransferase
MEKKDWAELVERLIREGILRSPNVIKAMRVVSRDPFLPENVRSYAAVDSPFPIGWGQTVSAPHD